LAAGEASVGLNRLSRSLQITVAAVALGLSSACGGGAAAPTVTAVPTSSPAAVPAPSPARPPLASPAPSPSSVAAVATPTTAVAQVAGESYEVESGDTLATIAQQFYGDPTQWRRIYDANKDTIGADPDKLKIGMKLTIPPKPS
jgi:nucleoid-associated protein YgaU